MSDEGPQTPSSVGGTGGESAAGGAPPDDQSTPRQYPPAAGASAHVPGRELTDDEIRRMVAERGSFRRAMASRYAGWAVAAVLAAAVVGLSVDIATTSSSSPAAAREPVRTAAPFQGLPFGGGGAFNGGVFLGHSLRAVGTVKSVSGRHFTMKTLSGSTVTVDEVGSSPVHSLGGGSATISKGERVLVIEGTTSGSRIRAKEILVLPRHPAKTFQGYFPVTQG